MPRQVCSRSSQGHHKSHNQKHHKVRKPQKMMPAEVGIRRESIGNWRNRGSRCSNHRKAIEKASETGETADPDAQITEKPSRKHRKLAKPWIPMPAAIKTRGSAYIYCSLLLRQVCLSRNAPAASCPGAGAIRIHAQWLLSTTSVSSPTCVISCFCQDRLSSSGVRSIYMRFP